jgi:alcohol dehydrogenase
MKAALFEAFRAPLRIVEVPDPACPRDGAVVRVEACGVCRSDWHAWTGADPDVVPPHVPGHEFAGVVEEAGPDCRSVAPGMRVTAPFILACGTCPACRESDPTVCPQQHVLGFSGWGAFARYVAVPHADVNLVRLPETVDYAEAAALGCRFTTAYRGLVQRAGLRPGEWVAVHGCGGVGLSAVTIATAIGARVVAVDIAADKLDAARALGAEATVDAAAGGDAAEAVRQATGGGAQVAIDALGTTTTLHNALACLAPLGRHVQIGMPTGRHARPTIPLLELIYARQLSLHGTRGMAARDFPALLDLLEAGRIAPARLVHRRIALEEAGAALAAMDGYAGTGLTVIDRFA